MQSSDRYIFVLGKEASLPKALRVGCCVCGERKAMCSLPAPWTCQVCACGIMVSLVDVGTDILHRIRSDRGPRKLPGVTAR